MIRRFMALDYRKKRWDDVTVQWWITSAVVYEA
jgi:hypothetical protein